MVYRVDIRSRSTFGDPHAAGVLAQIKELGIDTVAAVRSARLFFLYGDLTEQEAHRVAQGLLIDPVVEEYRCERPIPDQPGTEAEESQISNLKSEIPSPESEISNLKSEIPNPKSGVSPAVIEVHLKPGVMDPVAASTEQAIRDMGLSISSVRTARRYELEGQVSDEQREGVARKLLANAVIEDVHFAAHAPPEVHGHCYELKVVEVPIREMDDLGLIRLSRQGDLFLNLTEMLAIQDHYRKLAREPRDVELEMIAQTWSEHCVHKTFRSEVAYKGDPIPGWWAGQWTLTHLEDLDQRDAIAAALTSAGLEQEMLPRVLDLIGAEIDKRLGSGPVTVLLRYEGMEHRLRVDNTVVVAFGGHDARTGHAVVRLRIPNLINTTIFGATEKLAKPWCISVFKDNAGVIEFDETHAVCFKVETHNHPSAIEPYGGASTGIGGVIRDPLGTGLGAEPVANTDVFCFGPPDMPPDEVPKGVLHPRRVMRGVVAGVRDYGNRMGIPTVNGAVYFDRKYLGNPLVFCGTVGVLPRDKCFKQPRAGDAIVLVGGRTGRDGIHGATFSSGELTHQHQTEFSHAVQIGNAITEKKMLDTIVQARDQGLYTAITDCGAGGLSSAVGEMGEQLGAEVHLDRVPLKYAGLSYAEIWISEAQERMVLAVPPENLDRILKIFADEGVEATVIGHYGTDDRKLRLFYQDRLVGELDMEFLQEGLPRPTKEAVWVQDIRLSPSPKTADSYNDVLLKILAAPNVASKEWIIRQYDHEVQGGSAVKPLVGASEDGPGDAAVLRPVLGSRKGLVISCGMNPRLGELDPYQSALHAVDEALRNALAVGGDLERTAILDNFCWGNCNKPDRMGALVRSAKACYDAALAYGVPFISGKDSLNNEFQTQDGQTIAIPPALLISAISVVQDVARCVTADLKSPGNALFLLGRTGAELGGSHYLMVQDLQTGTDVPPVDMETNVRVMKALQSAIAAGAVRACHDLSEGGLAVAAAEMAFSGGLGVELDLAAVPAKGGAALQQGLTAPTVLFNESAGRFLVEVEPGQYDAFLRIVRDCPVGELGRVTDTGRIVIRPSAVSSARLSSPKSGPNSGGCSAVIDLPIAEAKAAWQSTFRL